MKKVKTYKNFVIAKGKNSSSLTFNLLNEELYFIFTKEEWSYGNGCRYHEFETENLQEAKDFIDSY
jgi:hypothetical protein